jgi:hypothetical protein
MKQWITFAALAATAAGALAAPPVEKSKPGGAAPEASARNDGRAPYRSAFEDYRRYEDRDVAPWREQNDAVGRAAAKQAPGSGDAPAHGRHGGGR